MIADDGARVVVKRPRKKQLPVAFQVVPTSQDIRKARRLATRTRSIAACSNCKVQRTKCDEFLPCSRCQKSGKACVGVDQVSPLIRENHQRNMCAAYPFHQNLQPNCKNIESQLCILRFCISSCHGLRIQVMMELR